MSEPLSRDTAVRALLRLSEYREGLVFEKVVDANLLTDYTDTDFAVGAKFQDGGAGMWFEFAWEYPTSPTEYVVGPALGLSFTLLLPEDLTQALSGQSAELSCTVDLFGADGNEINRTCEDPSFTLHRQGETVYAAGPNDEEISAECRGSYWYLPITAELTYSVGNAVPVHKIAPRITMQLDGYAGQFFVNDLDISSQGKQVIFCDFDFETAYGQPAREQFRFGVTDERLIAWEVVDRIGQATAANALRMGVRFTGEPYEPENEAFLGGIDTTLLHNPEHDWRNWGGLTCWWHLDGTTGSLASLEYGIVIPKGITYTGGAETAMVGFGAGIGFGSYNANQGAGNTELKEFALPNINIYSSQNGNTVFSTWGSGKISVTEYKDCYYARYTGETETPVMDYALSVVKMSWTGDSAIYDGYFYLTDFALSYGDETVLSYTAGSDMPSEMFSCYNHGSNGSYYYWNELNTSNYHLGLDTLPIQ